MLDNIHEHIRKCTIIKIEDFDTGDEMNKWPHWRKWISFQEICALEKTNKRKQIRITCKTVSNMLKIISNENDLLPSFPLLFPRLA